MSIKNSILGLIKYLPLLRELVVRDIKIRYRRSVLGILWTVLNPLMMMTVMTIVFSTVFRSNIENFALYYLSGYILYTFLNESTTTALFSIVDNQSLIKKVYIPKYLFPLSKVVSSFVNLMFSIVAMFIVMLVTGAQFHWTMLAMPVLLAYMTLFCCGLGMVLTTMHVYFRDIGHFYGVICLVWMYLTPLFYPATLLEDSGMGYLLILNPLNRYITYFRMLIIQGQLPSLGDNLICLGMAACIFLIGTTVFYKRQDKFILYI